MIRRSAPPARTTARTARLLGGVALALGALAAPAFSHEFWLLPETFEPRPGTAIGVWIFVGDGFEKGRPYARNPMHIKEFEAVSTTRAPISGNPGEDSPPLATPPV